ncbi:hypothetical protein WJX84_003317 [Apatococcus fuscideae]
MHTFRTRMCDCMGVDPAAPIQAAAPRVKILQRAFSARRSFLNLVEVEEKLEDLERATPFSHQILHNEGLTLKEQAHEFANADILVGMHGAALAMMIFMPLHSVLIEVMPFNWNGNHEFYEPLAKALSPISQLRVLGLDTERHDQTHFFLDAVKGDGAYIDMFAEEKLALLEDGKCPDRPGHPCGMPCACSSAGSGVKATPCHMAVAPPLQSTSSRSPPNMCPAPPTQAASRRGQVTAGQQSLASFPPWRSQTRHGMHL